MGRERAKEPSVGLALDGETPAAFPSDARPRKRRPNVRPMDTEHEGPASTSWHEIEAQQPLESGGPEQLAIGTCDHCDTTYDVGSRIDHCAREGTCWAHCSNRDVDEGG
jgi:hypothetical protein